MTSIWNWRRGLVRFLYLAVSVAGVCSTVLHAEQPAWGPYLNAGDAAMVNRYLRTGVFKQHPEALLETEDDVRRLVLSLDKAMRPAPHGFLTYRMHGGALPEVFDNFCSTAPGGNVQSSGSPPGEMKIYKIWVPKGHPIVDVRKYAREWDEVILHRGTYFSDAKPGSEASRKGADYVAGWKVPESHRVVPVGR